MLDIENSNESTEPQESSAPAPRRRRAASRTAGSPKADVAAEPTPEPSEAPASAAKSDLTPKRRKANTKPEGAAPTRRRRVATVEPGEPEAAAAQTAAEPVTDETKPTRRRATRKTAAPADAAVEQAAPEQPDGASEAPTTRRRATRPAAAAEPVDAPAQVAETSIAAPAEAPAAPAEEAPVEEQKPARRRRATRPAAAAEHVEAPAQVVETSIAAPAEAPAAPAEEAPVEEQKPARRRRATRAAAAPVHVEAPVAVSAPVEETEAVAVVEDAPVEETPVVEPPAPTRRRRASRPAAAPEVVETPAAEAVEAASDELEVESVAAVEAEAEPVREEAPARNRRRRASRSAAAPEAKQADVDDDPIGAALKAAEDLAEARRSVLADPFMTPEARAAELAALAGAIAADSDEDDDEDEESEQDESATEETSDEDDESTDEDSSDDDRPARRRRRRGGRRRRRNGSRDDDDTNGSDDDSSDDSEETSEGDEPSEDSDNGDSSDQSEEGGSTTRRRRRRRRRGDSDKEGSIDDEVTGIEGSTRMEAKRQRRKESRAAGRRRAPILSEAEFLARRESVDRKLVIRQSENYTQLAVIEDDILVEHYVDKASAASLIGNIYVGRVQNVLPSMEAAFIDIGRGRNAVLYAGEVDWAAFGVTGENRKVENVLKSGQSVLVQVTKDPVGAKGARLTSHISLPGRYIVYSPGGHLSGISRKLPDSERQRLRTVLGNLISDEESVIVRTAAEGVSEEELVRDVNRLKAQWEVIEKKSKTGGAPQALYAEPDLTLRIVRDLFTEDFGRLIVQGNGEQDDSYDAISAYVGHVAPHLLERVERFQPGDDGRDVFSKFRIDEQIAKALDRKVYLPSGGSLVLDRTEAMTVIDVNTGRFTGSAGNLEATVTSNNLEAAEEIVRQLRLRDLGGIIVIDFIDMVLPSNRDLLLRRLVECLSRDRTRHQVAEVTSLGLVQLTRKRIGTGLQEAFTEQCDHCHGAGYLRFDEPVESQAPADGGERKSGSRRRRK